MSLALILPATLLGYLAGFVAGMLGLGWLACLGVVALVGGGSLLGMGLVLAAGPRPQPRASAATPHRTGPNRTAPNRTDPRAPAATS